MGGGASIDTVARALCLSGWYSTISVHEPETLKQLAQMEGGLKQTSLVPVFDRETFAAGTFQDASSSGPRHVHIYNAKTQRRIRTMSAEHHLCISSLASSNAGPGSRPLLLSACGARSSTNAIAYLSDPASGETLASFQEEVPHEVYSANLSDDRVFLAGGPDPFADEKPVSTYFIRSYDLATGSLVDQIEGHTASVMALEYCQNGIGGGQLLSCSGDKTVKVWSLGESTECQLTLTVEKTPRQIVPIPDKNLLVVGLGETPAFVEIWDVRSTAEAVSRTELHYHGRVSGLTRVSDSKCVSLSHTVSMVCFDFVQNKICAKKNTPEDSYGLCLVEMAAEPEVEGEGEDGS